MLIALKGKKESGKTTSALYLEEQHGFVRINFKDALISELKQNFPDLLDELAKHYGLTIDDLFLEKPTLVRKLMQNYGTDVRRKDNHSYWTRQWKLVAQKFIDNGKNVVVDDVRFVNEAQAILDLGGTIIEIKRDGKDGDNHISETEMDKIPSSVTLINNGTLKDLYELIQASTENIREES